MQQKAAGTKTKRWIIGTLIAVIAAGAAVAGVVVSHGSTSSVNVTHDSSNGCVVGNAGTVVCDNNPVPPGDGNRDATDTTSPPAGSGPYPFDVINTLVNGTDIGLQIRSCDLETCGCATPGCTLLGYARDGERLYAICKAVSPFNGYGASYTWLYVKWPNDKSGVHSDLLSDPNDPYAGWANSAFTQSADSNGDIPTCSTH